MKQHLQTRVDPLVTVQPSNLCIVLLDSENEVSIDTYSLILQATWVESWQTLFQELPVILLTDNTAPYLLLDLVFDDRWDLWS